jgi:hypothetical protein
VDDVRKRVLLGVGAVVAVVAIVLGIVVLTHHDGEDTASTSTTSSSTTTSTSTTSSTTTTTAPTATTTLSSQDLDDALFPDLTAAARYSNPTDLVRDFALQVLGFDDKVVIGAFQPTGAGTGEIDLRPNAQADPTTVVLRQLADGSWIALSVSTDSIRLDTPVNGAVISSPQPLTGAAFAFEGRVNVTLYADGAETQIASTFVTGRGDGVLGPFDGQLGFQVPQGTTRGILVLSAASGATGATAAAEVIRVHF